MTCLIASPYGAEAFANWLTSNRSSLITADAIQCQQESSRFVTQDLGADYLWGLKGNQSEILERA